MKTTRASHVLNPSPGGSVSDAARSEGNGPTASLGPVATANTPYFPVFKNKNSKACHAFRLHPGFEIALGGKLRLSTQPVAAENWKPSQRHEVRRSVPSAPSSSR